MILYALPPAESRLSLRTIFGGCFAQRSNFAEELGGYLAAESCVLADSARSLLFLLFRHLQKSGGRGKTEVLIPGYTCYSVPAAAVKAGLRVSLYDMDPATLRPDMNDVNKKISEKTLAVVGQHLLGLCSDTWGLTQIARRHGAYCIEDSAQLMNGSILRTGVKNNGSDFIVFSFGRGKPLPLGAGGAVIVRENDGLTAISAAVKEYPQKTAVCLSSFFIRIFSHPRFYWILEKMPLGLGRTIFDPSFAVAGIPLCYRRAGVLGLRELEGLNRHRIVVGNIYNARFSHGTGFSEKNGSVPVRFPVLVKDGKAALKLFDYGVRQLYPLALCDLAPLRSSLADPKVDTPGAREIARRLITLPTHGLVTERIAGEIARGVKKNFSRQIEVPWI